MLVTLDLWSDGFQTLEAIITESEDSGEIGMECSNEQKGLRRLKGSRVKGKATTLMLGKTFSIFLCVSFILCHHTRAKNTECVHEISAQELTITHRAPPRPMIVHAEIGK